MDKLSYRKIAENCGCHRNTVRRYIWLFYEWAESGEYSEKLASLIHASFIDELEVVIRYGEWVETPLQKQLQDEISKVSVESYKKNKSITVMAIYESLQKRRRKEGKFGMNSEDSRLSYSTVYLAHKLQKEKNEAE